MQLDPVGPSRNQLDPSGSSWILLRMTCANLVACLEAWYSVFPAVSVGNSIILLKRRSRSDARSLEGNDHSDEPANRGCLHRRLRRLFSFVTRSDAENPRGRPEETVDGRRDRMQCVFDRNSKTIRRGKLDN